MIFLRCSAALVAASLIAPCSAQGAKDVILTKNGKRIRGVEVTEMSYEIVKYKRGDQELELPATLMLSVKWDDPPESFELARSALKNGEYADAAQKYSDAANLTERAPLKQEALFLAGEALLRGAGGDPLNAATARDSLSGFLSEHPTSYRFADAMLLLGRAQLQAGDTAEAIKTLDQLASDSLAKNLGAVWSARAKFEKAHALLGQNDPANARAAFRDAALAADTAAAGRMIPELASLKAQASVGVGETLIQEGKFGEALTFFRELASKSADDPTMRSAARAGEGEALFLQAEANGSIDGLREAQIAIAEANLLDSIAGDTTAKALYYSGKILLALGPDNEASNYKTRAVSYFQSVVSHYPNSSWAPKAGAELKR